MSDQPQPTSWDEPEQAPPSVPGEKQPLYRTYPIGHQPELGVLINGRWRFMVVHTRVDYPDGRVAYQGDVEMPMGGRRAPSVRNRTYWWPQRGRLRVERGTDVEPED